MVEIEAINSIRFSFDQLFEMLEREIAEDEDIGFNEFQYRYKCLEMAREDLNNIYDYIIMVLIRRDGLDDIYVE